MSNDPCILAGAPLTPTMLIIHMGAYTMLAPDGSLEGCATIGTALVAGVQLAMEHPEYAQALMMSLKNDGAPVEMSWGDFVEDHPITMEVAARG